MVKNSSNQLLGSYAAARDVPVGGGGYVISLDQSTDGSRMVHAPDVVMGMVRNLPGDKQWRPFMRPDNLPLAEHEPRPQYIPGGYPNADDGCAGMRIAPSNKDVIYAHWNGVLFKTTDGGATVNKTNAGTFYALSNSGTQRYSNRLIDIHPTNPNMVLIGTNHYAANVARSGVFYTFDGGATAATKITGLPAASDRGGQPGRNLVLIDPGDPTKGYAHVEGSGLYPLTIGASTVTAGALISGSPTLCNHMIATADGTIYLACGGGQVAIGYDIYRRTRAGAATTFVTTGGGGIGFGACTIAVDPNDNARWVIADSNGVFGVSFNSGGSWTRVAGFDNNFSKGDGEIAWFSNQPNSGVFVGMIQFDRQIASKLWIAHGLGIGWAMVPTTAPVSLTLHDFTKGNEEKVARCGLSIPGKPPMLGNWDYPFWRMDSLTEWTNRGVIPPINQPGNNGLCICSDLDVAQDDDDVIVMALDQFAYSSCFTLNDGRNWTTLPGIDNTFGCGGAIAINRKTNVILCDSLDGKVRFTKNFDAVAGTATWATVKLDGVNDLDGQIDNVWRRRLIVSADKERAGVFAFLARGLLAGFTTSDPRAGLWVTQDGGSTWAKTISGIIGSGLPSYAGNDPTQVGRAELRYVPGFGGVLVYTGHDSNNFTDRLYWISNDGTRAGGPAAVQYLGANVTDVFSFSFGPVAPGQTRPSVAFYGKVSGVVGLYFSYDWFATDPVLASRFPMENLYPASVVLADKNYLGRAFVGGIGWRYPQYGSRLSLKTN